MKCEKCKKDIDNDSIYCPYCGVEILSKKFEEKKHKFYDIEIIDNVYSDKSRNYFFVGFFIFDIVISTLLGLFAIPNFWVYMISVGIYMFAIIYGTKGIKFAIELNKQSKVMSGLVTGIIMIVISGFAIFTNIRVLLTIL